jgi:hypothetical protein
LPLDSSYDLFGVLTKERSNLNNLFLTHDLPDRTGEDTGAIMVFVTAGEAWQSMF